MKKYVLAMLLHCACALPLAAEMRFGVKLEPRMAYNRVYTKPYDAELKSQASVLRLGVGPLCDWLIQENCYISTGVQFSSHPIAYKKGENVQNVYSADYLSFPALLKFYTSEVTLDMRIYTELGVGILLRVNERIDKLPPHTTTDEQVTRLWSLRVILGLGVEYDVSLSTSLFGGLVYHRGLTNVLNSDSTSPTVYVYNDAVALSLGLRF